MTHPTVTVTSAPDFVADTICRTIDNSADAGIVTHLATTTQSPSISAVHIGVMPAESVTILNAGLQTSPSPGAAAS